MRVLLNFEDDDFVRVESACVENEANVVIAR
jgi:hypothetical protein